MIIHPLALGTAAGFLLSLPPDSGAMEAVNRGLQRGFLSSFLVGLGNITGDTLCYGALLFGFTLYFDRFTFLRFYVILACFFFLFLIGLYYLLGGRSPAGKWLKGRVKYVAIWFNNPYLFGLASSLFTPSTLILTAPFLGMLVGSGTLQEVALLLSGFTLGGAVWSALLALMSAVIGHRLGNSIKDLVRKAAGLCYLLTGLVGVYFAMMEMIRA
ncbi:LysE type translocator [Pelotomaculum sp. FP]|uniref:LysE family translocator n=1 Tax=Pelotomaculum sp. FP TaxID=261474 RepID=UPI0010661E7F|nr:LysE family transporter [Pelotomaculum sp. FP]TEB17299.1 LysE type translocator [Pelotomaculum sp. FP]